MNFTLTEERQMMQDSLRRFLADHYTTEARNALIAREAGFDRAIWAGLADLGIIGALFPEDQGGFGGAGFDIALVFEELGRAGALDPMMEALFAGGLLADAGRGDLVEQIIAGDLIATLAYLEPSGRYDPARIATALTDGRLTGQKSVVGHADAADLILVTALAPEGIALACVEKDAPGLNLIPFATNDGMRAAELRFDGTTAITLHTDALPLLERHIARATLAIMADTLGAVETAKTLTIDYLKTRRQFRRPLGTFQVLQHRMADLAIEVEQARSAVINAAGHLGTEQEARHISAAKNLMGRTARLVAEEAIQLHGGIGMTAEYALAHFAKRMVLADHKFGDEDDHLARFIAISET
jgi:alkylation response protein AidB-like acyl-CoA dehydrogenase